ncbi:MAG: fasciclin domain-containing protein, partial [Planctomycetota bacterium]
ALDGGGPFTVFAPTDEAFAALPALRDSLKRPEDDPQAIDHAWELRRATDAAYRHLRSTTTTGELR